MCIKCGCYISTNDFFKKNSTVIYRLTTKTLLKFYGYYIKDVGFVTRGISYENFETLKSVI